MQKKAFAPIGKRELQVFSQMMQMKFKPRSNVATTALVTKNKKIIEKQKSSKKEGQLQYSSSTLSRMLNRDKKLKYIFSLSTQYFIVGNQNQIDMISIAGVTHSFVDTDYCWSLSVPNSSPIENLVVEQKKCLIAIVSDKKLYFYKYNLKKCKQQPELIKEFDIKPDVRYIQFPKDSFLGLFYEKEFQLYNIEEHNKIYKKCLKQYSEPEGFKIFAVPQVVQNSLKIFFIEEIPDSKTFGLWYIKVNIQMSSIDIEKAQKVYDIKRNLKRFLVVENFSKDIIFMNIGAQILAARSGYIIDSANVNIQSENAKLKYISNQRLMHISDRKVEIYKMNILLNVVPNKIQVKPIDALQILDKPLESQFFGLITLSNDNFAVFYQNLSQYNIYTKGQATYWFALTEGIPMETKIQKIFDYDAGISTINPEALQQKCDMARKMGLNQKQLYLQIWNRSNKSSINDYQFILATRNYRTIHVEIEKKLKKESMGYRELIKIEESCLEILKQSVYGSKCSEENIQEYLTSHCFIRKLKLFRDIELHRKKLKKKSTIHLDNMNDEEDDNTKLLINIQQYYEHKEFDVKNYFVEKIIDLCLYDKDSRKMEIRMMIRNFKFLYRVIYQEILEQIIKSCKGKLIILLTNVPQILPYQLDKNEEDLENHEDLALYQGIWGEINDHEWDRNLFVENITTVDNKQVVKQLVRSIWYRRYWLTAHQLVNLPKDKIIQINRLNNSDNIFYYFISKVFELISDTQVQYQIIYFLEEHYEKIPEHLKGKIFLHYNLYKFYVENHAKAKLPFLALDEFLNLNDAKLFQYFFTQEKHTKNCILKSIKKIYEETCEQGEGLTLFNQGLLAYFKSQLSQISDLKYLLNRMNNQKTQFHQANLSIYQVLVRAMEYKLKLGSDKDIPIDEVLIYIENIPISRDNQVMKELFIVQKINQQAERFKRMKISMTIKQIIDNCEDVITKTIEYEFQVNKIRKITDEETLKQKTYKILAEVLVVKEKIYGEQHVNLPFFIYLSKLLEEISQIKLAKTLLSDLFLSTHFTIDDMMKENLVLYMYKWVFNKNPAFVANKEYIEELISLLPQQNQHRLFIESESKFATALSAKEDPLQYPISTESQYPRMHELKQILKNLPIEHVLTVDIDLIYQTINTMQNITLKQILEQQQELGISTVEKLSRHEVYSEFIIKYIEQNHLNHVIPLLKKLLTFDIPSKKYNMIYFIFLLQKLSIELNEDSKSTMTKLIYYCFDEPEILFEYIEYYFNSPETALQKSKKLKQKMETYIRRKLNYDAGNILFNSQSVRALSDLDLKQNSKLLINSIHLHLRNTKQEFKTTDYDILFAILCNQPYVAAKYIQLNQYQINFKNLRSYFSFIIKESVFDEHRVIDFCKKIFSMILQSNIKRKQIGSIILNPQKFYFNWRELKEIGIQQQIDRKVEKTLKSFQRKKKSLDMGRKKHSRQQEEPIQLQLKNPQQLSNRQPSQYPFSDSDNQAGDEDQPVNSKKSSKKKPKKEPSNNFDQKGERKKILSRKNSYFGDKNSQRKSSQQMEQSLQGSLLLSNKSISLKVPQKKSKIYVKRKPTTENSNLVKKNFSAITEKQDSSEMQSKIKNIKKRESQLNRMEESKLSKQESQYSVNQIAQVEEQQLSYQIKELIIQNYDKVADKIDFDVLSKQQSHEEFQTHLKDVIIKIFQEKEVENDSKIKIIKLVSKKYPKVPINTVFLAVYENIQKIEQKYNLGLPLQRMLPSEGLFIESKAFDDLFKLILPRFVEIATDQTIFKLSKLISLGFRKNTYESEIGFEYIKKMIQQFSIGDSQVELNIRFEIIRALLNKMSILSLKEKAVKLLDGIFANPALEQKVIENVVESVKRRGDAAAAEQIRKLMQKRN